VKKNIMSSKLQPTLWKTCRVLANPTRLALLTTVVRQPEICIQELAQKCRIERTVASKHLRALQARGLLRVRRVSRWVFYAPRANPSVQHADALLDAVLTALKRGDAFSTVTWAATAFTHERRIVLMRALAETPIDFQTLVYQCRISPAALHRHLAKLERRQMAEHSGRGMWRLRTPSHAFARQLQVIARLP
jgi:DNA-binding transcriptional ArsR family regulator